MQNSATHPSPEEPPMNRVGMVFYSRIKKKKTKNEKSKLLTEGFWLGHLNTTFILVGRALDLSNWKLFVSFFLFFKFSALLGNHLICLLLILQWRVCLLIGMVVGGQNGSLPSHHLQPRWLEYLRFRWDPSLLISHVKMSHL